MDIVNQQIDELINKAHKKQYSQEDINFIKKAAEFAKLKHEGQKRKSGEPYIIHPIATASFLIDWNMDVDTVASGLLHDVIEDTNTTEEEVEKNFNKDVARLVKYVSKVSDFSKKNRSNTINISGENDYTIQVFLSMSNDLRAMIIKLADRYHNMLTIHFLKPEKQIRIANETFNLYANIAGRLGMYELKTRLLDLSFQVLNPEAYYNTKGLIDNLVKENEKIWDEIIEKISNILDSYEIKHRLSTRIKGVYSTYEKLRRNFDIREIHDIFALRIIVERPLTCYDVLGLIHLNFSYIKKTFTDYISSPKLNLYQSIHTTLNQNDTLLEVQIRTEKMDMFANIGLAAHWYYKEAINENTINPQISNTINSLFLSNFLQSNSMDVLTLQKTTRDVLFDVLILNNNEWMIVNKNNTVLDIAYRYDRDNFLYLAGILKNGEQTTYDSFLEAGDTLKFNYAKNKQVLLKESWTRYATIASLKDFIKNYVEQQTTHQSNNITKFFKEITDYLKNEWVGNLKAHNIVKDLFGLDTFEEFFNFVTYVNKENLFFANLFNRSKKLRKIAYNQIAPYFSNYLLQQSFFKPIEGIIIDKLTLPPCCYKIPDNSIVGVLENNNLVVHNLNCILVNSKKQKLIKMEWDNDLIHKKQKRFKFAFKFRAQWSPSIGNNIVRFFNQFNLSLSAINIKRNEAGDDCEIELVVYTESIKNVRSLMQKLEQTLIIFDKPTI